MIYGKADRALIEVSECRYGRMTYLGNDRYMGGALARYGEYSESEVDLWRGILRPTALVADVGANIGIHTVALSGLVPEGFVVAIEPLTYLFYGLCANLFLNGITNVKAINACAGAAQGTLKVPALDYTATGDVANYGGMNMEHHVQGNPVAVVRLDDICQRLDFIKIDVEGMEWQVISGAKRIVEECQPILYVENNPGPRQRLLVEQINTIGYDCWWHLAPHYNPENHRGMAPADEGEEKIVSWNMVCLPANAANTEAMGCEPIVYG